MDKEMKRVRLLKIWEMLNAHTDEEHPMGTEEILSRLADMGIECVRSTLYEDIKTLQRFGYEIFCVRSTSNMYYVADRNISIPELLILMDSIQAASFVTEKKTGELVDKVAQLAGSQRGEVLKRNIVEFTVAKSENESILYSVSEIAQAIVNRKKIYFQYFDYDVKFARAYRMSKKTPDKKRGYKVNPLGTVFDNGYYYLFCYDDFFKGVSHYRIDRMDGVKMLEEDMTEGIDKDDFDLPTRKRQLFGMFGGDEAHVDFRVHRSLIDVIYDKFGDIVKLFAVDDEWVGFKADVQISPTFLAWCCSFGNKLKVVSPKGVVEKLRAYLDELQTVYK